MLVLVQMNIDFGVELDLRHFALTANNLVPCA
jgi:hypothetical protein